MVWVWVLIRLCGRDSRLVITRLCHKGRNDDRITLVISGGKVLSLGLTLGGFLLAVGQTCGEARRVLS